MSGPHDRALDRKAPEVRAVVVVPTFRRPDMLRATLASILSQTTADVAVLVVENDAVHRQGAALVESMAPQCNVDIFCVDEVRQGNVFAINTGFAAALQKFKTAEFFLMIDDDEVASPGWLPALLAAAASVDADIVGGPVEAVFTKDVRMSIRRHPVFRTTSYETGQVPIIYGTGNCLIRRRVFERMPHPYLDERYNFLGGGDTEFFLRCKMHGFRFYWESKAVIYETVPEERTKTRWVLARGVRNGAINRAIDTRTRKLGALHVAAKDVAICLVAILKMSWRLLRMEGFLVALHPVAIAAGRIAASMNLAPEQYRASDRLPVPASNDEPQRRLRKSSDNASPQ